MEDYVKRMDAELKELSERIEKLGQFINMNPIYDKLPVIKRKLMNHQLEAMCLYQYILEQRFVLEMSEAGTPLERTQ